MKHDEQVRSLLSKTIEAGATEGEEIAAVQKAFQLIRQHGLDAAEFAFPPRFAIDDRGFLVPAESVKTVVVSGRAGKIRTICEDLLMQGVATAEILAEVHRQVPEANTTKGCVSWYKSRLVRDGKLPKRGTAAAAA